MANRVFDRVFDWVAIALVVISAYLIQTWFTNESWLRFEYARREAVALEQFVGGPEFLAMCKADADTNAYLGVEDTIRTFRRNLQLPDDGVIPSTPEFWPVLYLCPFPDISAKDAKMADVLAALSIPFSIGGYIPRADYVYAALKADQPHLLAGNDDHRARLVAEEKAGNMSGCRASSIVIVENRIPNISQTPTDSSRPISFITPNPSTVATAEDRANLRSKMAWKIHIRCTSGAKQFWLADTVIDYRDDQRPVNWSGQWIRRVVARDVQYTASLAEMAASPLREYRSAPLPWLTSQQASIASLTLAQTQAKLLESRDDALRAGKLLGLDLPLRSVFSAGPYVIIVLLLILLSVPLQTTIAQDVMMVSTSLANLLSTFVCVVLPALGLIALGATESKIGLAPVVPLHYFVLGTVVLGVLCVQKVRRSVRTLAILPHTNVPPSATK